MQMKLCPGVRATCGRSQGAREARERSVGALRLDGIINLFHDELLVIEGMSALMPSIISTRVYPCIVDEVHTPMLGAHLADALH